MTILVTIFFILAYVTLLRYHLYDMFLVIEAPG
jgi:hypothetical protein